MKKNLISIITPVYNSFNKINNLLQSLNDQTNTSFEVIFIDDASTDDSYTKLKKELMNCSFLYQITKNKNNCGPGETRNKGINLAKGNYIMFVDSDDWIAKDTIDKLLEIVDNYTPDCIIFDYALVDKDNEIKKYKSINTNNCNITTALAIAIANGSTCCKLYKKSIIKNKVYFPNIIRSEDLAFNKVALSKCTKIYYLQENLYKYYQNNESIMHNINTLNIKNNLEASQFIIDNIDDFNEEVEAIMIREKLYLIVQIMLMQKTNYNTIIQFITEFNEQYPNWQNNKYITYFPKHIKLCLKLIQKRKLNILNWIFKLKK